MSSEEPAIIVPNDGFENDENNLGSLSKNHSKRKRKRPRKQKKRKSTRNRFIWMICLGAIFYAILIYVSIELLDRVWSEEQLQDQLPIERLRNRDKRVRAAHHHGRLPYGKQRPKHPSKPFKRNNVGMGQVFDRIANFLTTSKSSNNFLTSNKRNTTKIVQRQKNPTLVPKFSAPEQLLLPKPIINVGFPKAGTSTIFSFFHCNGLKAQHWYCCEDQQHPSYARLYKLMSSCMLRNMAAQKPIFEDCGDYDVYTEINGPRHSSQTQDREMLDDGTLLTKLESTELKRRIFFPQHHHLDKIHHHCPNATLILNKRETEAWIQSVFDWNANLQYHLLNEFYQQNATRFLFENVTGQHVDEENNDPTIEANAKNRSKRNTKTKLSFGNSIKRRNLLKSVYNYHMQYVRDWVASHPSHALVEIEITDEDAGKTLAAAFGLREECWGHFNQNKKPTKGTQKMAISGTPNEARATTLRRNAQAMKKIQISGQPESDKIESTKSPINN